MSDSTDPTVTTGAVDPVSAAKLQLDMASDSFVGARQVSARAHVTTMAAQADEQKAMKAEQLAQAALDKAYADMGKAIASSEGPASS